MNPDEEIGKKVLSKEQKIDRYKTDVSFLLGQAIGILTKPEMKEHLKSIGFDEKRLKKFVGESLDVSDYPKDGMVRFIFDRD